MQASAQFAAHKHQLIPGGAVQPATGLAVVASVMLGRHLPPGAAGLPALTSLAAGATGLIRWLTYHAALRPHGHLTYLMTHRRTPGPSAAVNPAHLPRDTPPRMCIRMARQPTASGFAVP